MDSARSTGAAMGVGPKATNAQVSKQLGNFSNAEKQIGEYIAGLGVQQGVNYQQMLMQGSNGMQQGPRGQSFAGGQYSTPGSNPLGQLGTALSAAAPWMQGMSFPGQGQVGAAGAQGALGNGMTLPGMSGANDFSSSGGGVDFSLDALLKGGAPGQNFGQGNMGYNPGALPAYQSSNLSGGGSPGNWYGGTPLTAISPLATVSRMAGTVAGDPNSWFNQGIGAVKSGAKSAYDYATSPY
jgi:hypothetical protein